jgi:hypothetical protein
MSNLSVYDRSLTASTDRFRGFLHRSARKGCRSRKPTSPVGWRLCRAR